MVNGPRQFPVVNEDAVFSKFGLFLSASIGDEYTVHRICRNLEQYRMDLHVMLTAKVLFDKVKSNLSMRAGYVGVESLSEIDKFLYDRRRRELEAVAKNEHFMFIGCTIVASKLYMDFAYANFSWIDVCYYAVDQINTAERYVLQALDYNVIVGMIELQSVYDDFSSRVELIVEFQKVTVLPPSCVPL